MDLKLVWIGFFLFFSQNLFSQEQSTKSIKASSKEVDIRVGTDFFAKGGWSLDPKQNPDIFRIGSKWNYDTLRVSFITNLDSISFLANPDSQYNFIVLLDNKTPCHIQVLTAPNPVFMKGRIVLILSIIFIISSILLSRIHSLKGIRRLLLFGFVSPFLFWCFTLIAGFIQEDYNHSKNVISELGTLGSKAEIFTSTFLIIIALSSLIFSIGFIKSSQILKISKLPAIATLIMPLSSLWAAIFPLGNEFHGLLGPGPLLLILGVLLSLVLWKKDDLKNLRKFSFISILLFLLIGLRFVPNFGPTYEGLIQRFFYIGWTLWLLTIAIGFRKKLNTKDSL